MIICVLLHDDFTFGDDKTCQVSLSRVPDSEEYCDEFTRNYLGYIFYSSNPKCVFINVSLVPTLPCPNQNSR